MIKLVRISLIVALASTFAPTFAANIEVVSKPFAPLPQSIGDSLGLHLSADGGSAAFSSSANGLLPSSGETTPTFSLSAYLKNLESGEVLLLSKNPDGQRADGDSVATGISSDGRFVVFESDATDLVPDDINETSDIFLFDRASNSVMRVSTVVELGDTTNELADATGASLTSDGRYVFYEAQVDGESYYFTFDRNSGSTVAAITGPDGEPWPSVLNPSPSDDGRFVTFRSPTNLLAPQASNAIPQLFLHDTLLRTNYWLSRTTSTNLEHSPTNGPAAYVSDALISKDSRVVAFVASDLSEPLNPLSRALYLYSIDTASSFRIPWPDPLPAAPQPGITSFDMSADAQNIVYTLTHLPLPDGTWHRLYLYNRSSNTNRLLTTSPGQAVDPQISSDGNRIVFTRVGTNAPNPQLYLFDLETGSAELLSRSASGAEADEPVLNASLSADGSVAGFETLASNLSANDDPIGFDLFTVNLSGTNPPGLLSTPHSQTISSTAAGISELARPYWTYLQSPVRLSTDGQRMLLASSAPDLAPGDPFSDLDLFLADLAGNPTKLLSSVTNAPDDYPLLMDASADLNRVLFGEGRSLYLFDKITESVTPATVLPDGSTGQWYRSSGYLSADGRRFLFAASTNSERAQFWVRDLEKLETQLVPDAQLENLYPHLSQISGGGRYVLNPASIRPTNITLRVTQVIDLQTGQKRMLVGLFPVASAWDDSIMLFARPGQGVYASELWTYNPVSYQTNLVATNVTFPVLSGDGSVIVYSQNVDNQWHSFIHETATATTTPLTVGGGDFLFEQPPAVTPDGRFIAFTIDNLEPGVTQADNLYVFDRILTNLTTVTAPDGNPIQHLRRYAISADGRTVVFDSADDHLVANDRNLNNDTFAVRLAIADTDKDSLEDGWEIQHFGSLAHAASADADSDGVPNGLEFQTGTDPQDAASKFTLSATPLSKNEVTLEWPSVMGKTYQLQTSTTLAPGSWTDFGPPITAFNSTTRATVPANDRAFYRTKVRN